MTYWTKPDIEPQITDYHKLVGVKPTDRDSKKLCTAEGLRRLVGNASWPDEHDTVQFYRIKAFTQGETSPLESLLERANFVRHDGDSSERAPLIYPPGKQYMLQLLNKAILSFGGRRSGSIFW